VTAPPDTSVPGGVGPLPAYPGVWGRYAGVPGWSAVRSFEANGSVGRAVTANCIWRLSCPFARPALPHPYSTACTQAPTLGSFTTIKHTHGTPLPLQAS
jgi:hypothetical protein